MTKEEKVQLKWRLSKLPSVEEIQGLVKDGILTKEEAREILFSVETKEDREQVELADIKKELELLREIVKRNTVITQPVYIEHQRPWTQPYIYWMSSTSGSSTATPFRITSANSRIN